MITGDDRNREIATESQQTHGHDEGAHHQRHEGHEVGVARRAGDSHRRHAGSKDGGDRRIGAHGHMPVGADQRKHQRPGHEGVQSGGRGHDGQVSGGDLFGDGQGEQSQAGDDVGAQPRKPILPERWRGQPWAHSASYHLGRRRSSTGLRGSAALNRAYCSRGKTRIRRPVIFDGRITNQRSRTPGAQVSNVRRRSR